MHENLIKGYVDDEGNAGLSGVHGPNPCGCEIIGNGTLPHPIAIKYCDRHGMIKVAAASESDAEDRLYPELSKEGEAESLQLLEHFRASMKAIADEVIRDLYCDIGPHIETDAWSNFRNEIVSGLQDYRSRHAARYDFQKIRESLLKNHREDIVADLNQDLLKENEKLKADIERLREDLRRSYG